MEPNRRRVYNRARRLNTRKRSYGSADMQQAGLMETLTMQGIVSGLILAFLLFVRVIDMPLTTDLRVALKAALSEETEVEDLRETVTSVSDSLAEMKNSVKTIFGEPSPKEEYVTPVNNKANDNNFQADDVVPVSGGTVTDKNTYKNLIEEQPKAETEAAKSSEEPKDLNTDFRIDEDILEEINSRQDIYLIE